MHNLALYEFNGEGGAKDQADASRWFRKAAEQGVVDSQYNLARLYDNGGYGVPQNKAEAYKWYLVAAA
ncbi:sel1 repeat family protein, partial [Acinetobacter baumannii]